MDLNQGESNMRNFILIVLALHSSAIAIGQEMIAVRQLPAAPTAQQVINLGDVVANVVIAKVLGEGADAELSVAKFGSTDADTVPRIVTTMKVEARQRTVTVNGETKVQDYNVTVPVTTVVHRKENFTPTEKDRSVPISTVQAFDLKGKPVNAAEWTKRLLTPQHVLLLREPINDSNKLNPFYSAILREDILLLFLQGRTIDARVLMETYSAEDLPVWTKDGEDLDPNIFVELIKSEVTPNVWGRGASIRPYPEKKSFVVAADQNTHEALANFLRDMRNQIPK